MKGIEGTVSKYVFIAFLGVILFSCDEEKATDNGQAEIRPLTKQEEYLVNASNEFALDLLNENEDLTENNFAISPISTGMSLGIIGNTTDDISYEEFKYKSGLPDLTKTELNKAFFEVSNMLPHLDENVNIKFCNSIWSKYELYENDDFYTKVLAYFNADIHEIRAEKEFDISNVNKWIQTKSDFVLNSVNSFNPKSNFQIVNSALFKANYFNEPPIKVIKSHFMDSDGKSSEVNFNLYQNKKVFVSKQANQMSVELPLGNSQFVLNIVIPKSSEGIYLNNDIGSYEYYDNLIIPDIIVNHEYNPGGVFDKLHANDYLKKALKANFKSSIFIDPVTTFINKSYISLSGKDNKTLNVTTLKGYILQENDLILDQSFYYFIKEKNSDLIIFEGKYDHPV